MLPLKINSTNNHNFFYYYNYNYHHRNYYYYTVELRRDDQELHRRSGRHFENRTRSGVFGRTVTMTTQDVHNSVTAKCILCRTVIVVFCFCYNL